MLETPRLRVRSWRADDVAPFATMCADAEVMRYFPERLSPKQAAAFVERVTAHEAEHGYTFWAVEERAGGRFVGFTGLYYQTRAGLPFAPGLEIGWRLRREVWRRGYTTEAARACLTHAFGTLGASEVHAITSAKNAPSLGVMRKLGMERRGAFEHPAIAADTGLREHEWYSVRAGDVTSRT